MGIEKKKLIPKTIHYCWFGRSSLPLLALKCIASWKKFLPDYEIKEWNEDNYNVRANSYISEAYDAKKYAFVSDYARFDILFRYGGVYFDTDVEVIKDLTPIIEQGAFIGVENAGAINAGLGMASPAAMEIFDEIINSYNDEHFVNVDGSLNLITIVTRVSDIFANYGFVNENIIQDIKGVRIYPMEYFCPKDYKTGVMKITEKTYTIHWFDGSWCSNSQLKFVQKKYKLIKKYGKFGKIFGVIPFCVWQIKELGIIGFIKRIFIKTTNNQ